MKLSDYIRPLMVLDRGVIDDEICIPLQLMVNIDGNLSNYIRDTINTIYENYRVLGYHFMPIDDDGDFEFIITRTIFSRLKSNSILLTLFKKIGEDVKLTDLYSYAEYNENIDVTENGGNTSSKQYGKKITRGDRKDEHSMSENSPINSDILSINSPNIKNAYVTDNEMFDQHSGTDTVTDTFNKSGGHESTKYDKTPDVYSKYVEVIEKYNIPKIIDEVIRSIIWEFNSIR